MGIRWIRRFWRAEWDGVIHSDGSFIQVLCHSGTIVCSKRPFAPLEAALVAANRIVPVKATNKWQAKRFGEWRHPAVDGIHCGAATCNQLAYKIESSQVGIGFNIEALENCFYVWTFFCAFFVREYWNFYLILESFFWWISKFIVMQSF